MIRVIWKVKYLILPIVIIVICILGDYIVPNNPNKVDMINSFHHISMDYPLGTDQMGRCIFSRLLYGGRTTIGIILLSELIIFTLATPIGLFLGYQNKLVIITNSLLNAVTGIPPIAYLLIFVGAWGNGVKTMLVAMTVSLSLRLIKLVKTRTEEELKKAYIMCSIASGVSRGNLLFRDILPNIFQDELHYLCLSSAEMILIISGFSFIGIGFGDNIIDWGKMVSDGREVVISHPTIILFPVIAIVLCAIAFYGIAQALEVDER